MFRKLIIGLLAVIAISLGGCVTDNSANQLGAAVSSVLNTTTTITNVVAPDATPNVKTKISQIQSLTVQACGFLPLAKTVADLFSSNPYVSSAEGYADQICDVARSVKIVGVSRSDSGAKSTVTVGTLYGVKLRGKFLH